MFKRPNSELTSIKEIVSKSLEDGYLGLAKEMVRVFEVWDEAVGPYNAARARPESIKGGCLTVLVESPVWIDRFGYLKAQFQEQVNQALGAPLVEEIVFRVGTITPPGEKIARAPAAGRDQSKQPPVISEKIQEVVAGIKDPDLKERLAALLARQNPSRKG